MINLGFIVNVLWESEKTMDMVEDFLESIDERSLVFFPLLPLSDFINPWINHILIYLLYYQLC
jgi:hypothetical protein